MLHYRKGDNVERELSRADLPFDDCLPKKTESDFLWMHVKGGSKVDNVIKFAKNALDKGEYSTVVWSSTGGGGGVVKTISCAEILKRSYSLYQVTRMCYTTVEEHWLPQMDGLEDIIANRQIPTLHILMTLDTIDDNVSGLQKPGSKTDFWLEHNRAQSGANMNVLQRHQRGEKQMSKRPPRSGNTGRHFRTQKPHTQQAHGAQHNEGAPPP